VGCCPLDRTHLSENLLLFSAPVEAPTPDVDVVSMGMGAMSPAMMEYEPDSVLSWAVNDHRFKTRREAVVYQEQEGYLVQPSPLEPNCKLTWKIPVMDEKGACWSYESKNGEDFPSGVVVLPSPLDYKTDFKWRLATPQDIREAFGGETPEPVSSESEGPSGLLLMVLGLIGVSALANSRGKARVSEGAPVEVSEETARVSEGAPVEVSEETVPAIEEEFSMPEKGSC